jgi:hypothetical protein
VANFPRLPPLLLEPRAHAAQAASVYRLHAGTAGTGGSCRERFFLVVRRSDILRLFKGTERNRREYRATSAAVYSTARVESVR